MKHCDVDVRGAGIVGTCLALSLARLGLSVRLHAEAAPTDAAADVRAFALNAASVKLLRDLKVWDGLPIQSRTAVREMVVHGDATGSMLEFSAWQQRLGELAWIVDAPALEAALAAASRYSPQVERIVDAGAKVYQPGAALTAMCEGKHSGRRDGLGVVVDRRAYGHSAIAARVTAASPHLGRARQWFRSPDILALLPFDMPKAARSYAIVWSMPDTQKDELMQLGDAEFAARLSDAAGEPLELAGARACWPLSRAEAQPWCGPGWVLLGDAAHVVHPLAGQGLNLGLADVATLTRVISEREAWRALGDEKLLRRYVRDRAAPTRAMTMLTDGLLNLFAHPDPTLRELRNRGLGLVNRLAPVKRWLADRALDS